MVTVQRYSDVMSAEWNAFVAESKNGTFLFDRRYMDYHRDRFADHSLVFRDEREKIIALLPANEQGEVLYSHQGLTYGGFVLGATAKVAQVQMIVDAMMLYLREKGFCQWIYKPVPWIYHVMPAEEDLYVLFQKCGAQVMERSIASVINISHQQKWQELRRRSLRKSEKAGVSVRESNDIEAYWQVLEDNLLESHNARPVHSLAEMKHLRSLLPENIKLYVAESAEGVMLGGILLYVTPSVIRTQYISASREGKRCGAIDAIVHHLLEIYADRNYLDLGTSTLDSGRILNESLIFQKEGFGARGVCFDTYKILP